MEALIAAVPDPLLILDFVTARVLYLNDAAKQFFNEAGVDHRVKIDGKLDTWEVSFGKLLDEEGRELPFDQWPIPRALNGDEFFGKEYTWIVNQRTYNLKIHARRLPPAHGRKEKVLINMVDISDHKSLERELRQAVQLRDEFMTVAAHELRSPITGILLQIQSLLASIPSERVNMEGVLKRLGLVERAASRLSSLVENMLDVSRMSKVSNVKLRVEEIELCELIKDAVARQAIPAQRNGVTLQLRLPDYKIKGTWDATRLDQIVSNLLSNAIKYGKKRPVDVQVESVNDHAIVVVRDRGIGVVRDRGIGVAISDRERVFKRFERAVSPEKFSGLGVGLWIAAQAAEAMKGSIAILDPDDGEGSIFKLTLPINNGVEKQ